MGAVGDGDHDSLASIELGGGGRPRISNQPPVTPGGDVRGNQSVPTISTQ